MAREAGPLRPGCDGVDRRLLAAKWQKGRSMKRISERRAGGAKFRD